MEYGVVKRYEIRVEKHHTIYDTHEWVWTANTRWWDWNATGRTSTRWGGKRAALRAARRHANGKPPKGFKSPNRTYEVWL